MWAYALVGHEMLLSRHSVSDKTLREIVDDVFLPLVRAVARVT